MAPPMPSGFRSAIEYCFDEKQADVIVRMIAYHRRDFDLSVIWFSAREHVEILPSIATPFPRILNVGLGSLDSLPLELFHEVLFHLDMQTIFKLRQLNTRSRQMVDSLRQYQMVVSHGLNLLCALLRTRLATFISLFEFYEALCTKNCTHCGNFAGFISLLTWKRCCFKCLQEAPAAQMQSLAAVRKQFQLTKAESTQLRSFKTLPGIYSLGETLYKSGTTIVSVHQVMLACKEKLDTVAQCYPEILERNRKFNFMGSCALPYYDKRTGKVEYGVSCAGCQLALEKSIIGTRGEEWAFEARDKVYDRDSFLEHFRWCEQAQLLWISSGEGDNRPAELPEAVRRGGYFNQRQ